MIDSIVVLFSILALFYLLHISAIQENLNHDEDEQDTPDV